ncbi:choice-of-anchor D domain-containing protein [Flagellimonas sp.]|uniref:choice-of-anchor D domain-containing protein n=1 Tax=Flagellimonas sp. TaxID=2058762 RepID=UPI000C0AD5B8|nr:MULTISPECIES: choice-of-anchor D domain-containing protein [unclassified Allomuricauda]MAU14097.1 hypothetical protein [Allomuricauda sp.]
MKDMKFAWATMAVVLLWAFGCSKDDGPTVPSGTFEIDQSSMDFGHVPKGEVKSMKATVTNEGEGDLMLKEVAFSGTNASDFNLGSSIADRTIQMGASLELEVVFEPTQIGAKEALLTINSNLGVHTVKLSGESLDPDGVVNVPDAALKTRLLGLGKTSNGTLEGYTTSIIDTNEDGEIQVSEAWAQEGLLMCLDGEVTDMTGLEAFVNIRALLISGTQVSALDLSDNQALEFVFVQDNVLTQLDISELPNLRGLYCNDNQLTSLDVSNNPELKELMVYKNQLTGLDVSQNPNLNRLVASDNQLGSLDVTNNTELVQLRVHNNQLTALDFTNNAKLIALWANGNELSQLDLSQNTLLMDLDISNNQLNTLDISKLLLLEELSCGNNQLTNLDLSNNVELKSLSCIYNALTNLDVTQNTKLISLSCFDNGLASLDVSQNVALQSLYCGVNELTALDVSSNVALSYLTCEQNQLVSLNLANGVNQELFLMNAQNNDLSCIQIDEGFVPPVDWVKDETANYNSNCP